MGRPGKKLVRLGVAALQLPGLFQDLDAISPTIDGTATPCLPAGFDQSNPEVSYAQLVSSDHRRRLGQFFTPEPIAKLLCRWTAQIEPKAMLDPSAGTGVLSRAFRRTSGDCEITALDVDPVAIQALCRAVDSTWRAKIACQDFLTWNADSTFDAIVANPPYLRHHDTCYPPAVWRRIEQQSGIKLSRLSNAYVLFILEICRRLRPGGRAAVIVPGEWLNANFGTALKRFLLGGGWLQQLVYFSHAEVLFPDALTTACLLLIQRPRTINPDYRLRTLFVASATATCDLERLVLGETTTAFGVTERYFFPDELLTQSKWNSVLEAGLPSSHPGFVALGELATTCRGIATGANKFFHLTLENAQSKRLQDCHLKPCIGSARDVVGYLFGSADFARLEQTGAATRLFTADGTLSTAERAYLVEGERSGLSERYLLSQRSPWYTMERREPAPIWAAVFGRTELRFVCNEARIRNLTTFHAIYPHNPDPAFGKALTACLNSPIVQERARLQHRVYGGGLLKFEPKDLLEIQVPDVRRARPESVALLVECLTSLDEATKAGHADRRTEILARLNVVVLKIAEEAANRLQIEEHQDQSELGPLWAQHKRRDAPAL